MCIFAYTILIWSSGQTCEQTRSCYSILQMRSERLWEVLWVAEGPSTDKWLSWDWSIHLQALRPLIFFSRVSRPSFFPSKSCFYISQSRRKNSSVSDTDSIIWALSLGLWSVLAGGGAPGGSQSLLHRSPKGAEFPGSLSPKKYLHMSWSHLLAVLSNWLQAISSSVIVEPRCIVKTALATGCRMGCPYWLHISTWLSPPSHTNWFLVLTLSKAFVVWYPGKKVTKSHGGHFPQ